MTSDTPKTVGTDPASPCIASGHIPVAPCRLLRSRPLGGQDCRDTVNLSRSSTELSRSAELTPPQLKRLCS